MGKALALRKEYRLTQWAQIADECAKSGLTNKAFCEQRGISEKNYYYWLRQLREAAADIMSPQLVEISPVNKGVESGTLHLRYHEADITITEETPASLLEVTLQLLKKL
jgi:transposase-like protein